MSGVELIATPPQRRRPWLRSLTSRLVVGVVALVVVMVCAIGSATYFFLRSYLDNRLDQQLQSTASQASQSPEPLSPSSPQPGSGLEVQAQSVWAVVLWPTGSFLGYPRPPIKAMFLTAADQRKVVTLGVSQAMTIETTDGQQLRVTTRPFALPLVPPGGPVARVVAVIGLSTDDERRTLSRLLSLEVFIGASAVLVAWAASYLGVQRSLRNLYRVTGTAQEVAAELSPEGAGLDRRVPLVEEGTEVGQLAESMNTLLSAVETQFKARVESENRMRQFLADASHELRTPLTSIRGYAELARMQRAANGDSQTSPTANLDRIESEGTRMSRLVDDLLLLARGDADGTSHLEERAPVDMDDVLDDAVSGSRAAFPGRPIELEATSLPAVSGDRDQLLRAVRNLVTNAAVHSAEGRPILVRGVAEDGGVVVTVADGGPGLPPEQAALVFERFWRADKARTRARGGSGLGLSIVAAIVRAHGGAVRFDSDVEQGSTVTMWLPAIAE